MLSNAEADSEVVSLSNTLGMVHQLTALRWDLPKYLSSMYKRHMSSLLVLWVFCVWQSLVLTGNYIYFGKVLKGMLPVSNTSNITDLDTFNDFMSIQTNSSYDLLAIVKSGECMITGRQTCASW